MAVGTYLGYVWGYKLVEAYDEQVVGGPTAATIAVAKSRRRVIGAAVGVVAAVVVVYDWGGEAALWRAGLAVVAAGLAVAAWLGHLCDQKSEPTPKPKPGWAVAFAIGALVAAYSAYQTHFNARYECRVERAGHLILGGRWVRDPGPDRVFLKNTSIMPLTGVHLTVTASERRFGLPFGTSWKNTLTVSRVEPGQEVSWQVSMELGQARYTFDLDCDQDR